MCINWLCISPFLHITEKMPHYSLLIRDQSKKPIRYSSNINIILLMFRKNRRAIFVLITSVSARILLPVRELYNDCFDYILKIVTHIYFCIPAKCDRSEQTVCMHSSKILVRKSYTYFKYNHAHK
jgi:hypothetical protein